MPDEPASVLIRRGDIHLSRELYDAHLAGIASVALLARAPELLVVPLAPQSAGGLLLKIRNARGDRVLHAQEFLRAHGVPEDFSERRYAVRWDHAMHALAIAGVPIL